MNRMQLPLAVNVTLTFIGLAIALGNGTVFLVFFSNRSLRTLTNHFVLSLAVSDFFVGTVLLPLQVWSPTSAALGPLIAFMLIASLSNISGCTYDRYIAVQNPLRYHSILTPSKVRKTIVLIWAVPIFIAVIPQTWLHQTYNEKQLTQRIYVGLMSVGVLLTCSVLTRIYIGIFRVAKRHVDAISCMEDFAEDQRRGTTSGIKRRNSLKSLVKHVKATKLVALIGVVFVLCWCPLVIINIFDSLNYRNLIPEDFAKVALFTIFANSLINPMIYAFFQKDFRATLSKLICRHRARRRSALREEASTLICRNHNKASVPLTEIKNDDEISRQKTKRPSTVSFQLTGLETSRV